VILRVEQDGTPAAGNPFTPYCSGATSLTCDADLDCGSNGPAGSMVASYFAYGIRNSFGMTRDAPTGALWMTENGPNNYDEVNRVSPGMNSGWNQLMGPDARDPQGLADLWNLPARARPTAIRSSPGFATIAPRASCSRPGAASAPTTTTRRSSATATWDSSTPSR